MPVRAESETRARQSMTFSTADTIVAIATPPGRGGIGVVRLSGADARAIAARLIDRAAPLEPRHATLVRVVDAQASSHAAIDEVVATWFQSPRAKVHDFTSKRCMPTCRRRT